MVLALSMSGSAILRPVSTIGDEDRSSHCFSESLRLGCPGRFRSGAFRKSGRCENPRRSFRLIGKKNDGKAHQKHRNQNDRKRSVIR